VATGRKRKKAATPIRAVTPDRATIDAALAALKGASPVEVYRAGFAAGRRAQAEAEARARSERSSHAGRYAWTGPRRAEEENYTPGQMSVNWDKCRANILDYAKEYVAKNQAPTGGWNPNHVKDMVLRRVTHEERRKPEKGYSDSAIKRVVAKRWPEIKKAAKRYRAPS